MTTLENFDLYISQQTFWETEGGILILNLKVPRLRTYPNRQFFNQISQDTSVDTSKD